jgi:hypothetical protein
MLNDPGLPSIALYAEPERPYTQQRSSDPYIRARRASQPIARNLHGETGAIDLGLLPLPRSSVQHARAALTPKSRPGLIPVRRRNAFLAYCACDNHFDPGGAGHRPESAGQLDFVAPCGDDYAYEWLFVHESRSLFSVWPTLASIGDSSEDE